MDIVLFMKLDKPISYYGAVLQYRRVVNVSCRNNAAYNTIR